MIDEARQDRLDELAEAIEAAGYEVTEAAPKLERTITEKVDDDRDDIVGFLVVRTPVELKGATFEGDLILNVHRDHLSNQGVDVTSHADDPLPGERQDLLSTLVPPRDVTDEDGETRRVWSYYPPPPDLPAGVVPESRDNVDELMDEFESIHERVFQQEG